MINMRVCVLLLVIFCCFLTKVDSLKILAIFPYTGKSHHYVIDPLLNALAQKGHEVTVVSRFPSKTDIPNRKDIVFGYNKEATGDIIDLHLIEMIPKALSYVRIAGEIFYLTMMAPETCELLFSNKEVQNIIQSEKKYDVALLEQFNTDCSLGITHKLGIPIVGLTSDTLMAWHFDRFGAITNPSFVPCHHLGYGTKPNIFEVAVSWSICEAVKISYYLFSTLPTQSITKKYLGDDIPNLDRLARNISLVLTNSYFPLHGAFPTAPNEVGVGGLYIQAPKKLPEDIQNILDKAENGVIYFSFGSMIKMNTMPFKKLKALQDAFTELKETVIWKWENDTMPNQPNNVIIRKWLPQFEILNHKNVKAFITHGGMLSITEAAHTGVPVVAIPFLGDQFLNSQAAKESGLGTVLHYCDITKESILDALNIVLKPEFRSRVKKLQRVFLDRPMSPMDTAIYWIEHVATHGGEHLRPAYADLPLYRYLLLDVIGFIFIVTFTFCFVFYLSCKMCYSLCCKRRKSKTE